MAQLIVNGSKNSITKRRGFMGAESYIQYAQAIEKPLQRSGSDFLRRHQFCFIFMQ